MSTNTLRDGRDELQIISLAAIASAPKTYQSLKDARVLSKNKIDKRSEISLVFASFAASRSDLR